MVEPFKRAIALTGGIATGKSTVCNLLKLYGFRIIDADNIAHQLLDEYSKEIAKLFGEEFIEGGRVNRKALGKLIFHNKNEKAKLEHFIHPKIRAKIEELSKKEERFGVPYIIDIPLYFETKSYPIQKSVLVYAPKELQLSRLTKREGLSRMEALKRIELQMDIEKKRDLADFIIDNSYDLKHLQKEVEKFVEKVKKEYAVG